MVPAQITIIPPVAQRKPEVGKVASPGCSNTMRGLVRSPSASQTALPKARAPLAHSPYALASLVSGIGPQCLKSLRLMTPAAPCLTQNSRLASSDTTATARPPWARVMSSAMLPRPPAAPQTRTTSPGSTVCGAHPISIRYAVEAQSRKHPASSQVRRLGLGRHWCAWARANWQ